MNVIWVGASSQERKKWFMVLKFYWLIEQQTINTLMIRRWFLLMSSKKGIPWFKQEFSGKNPVRILNMTESPFSGQNKDFSAKKFHIDYKLQQTSEREVVVMGSDKTKMRILIQKNHWMTWWKFSPNSSQIMHY